MENSFLEVWLRMFAHIFPLCIENGLSPNDNLWVIENGLLKEKTLRLDGIVL
jgi:hypothetical protein